MAQITGLAKLKKLANKAIGILVLIVAAYFSSDYLPNNSTDEIEAHSIEANYASLEKLHRNKTSGKIITIKAKVIKHLADDLDGSRHQKMILQVANNTILLAHNIDVAPRVPVKKGEQIIVKGEYEWNKLGGVIHWTHRDESNKHPDGWVKYKNKTYK